MNDSRIKTIQEIKEFIKVANNIEFQGKTKKEKYAWIENTLDRFGYFRLKKGDKSILKTYMMKLTGYSDAQMTRVVAKKRRLGKIFLTSTGHHSFPTKYTPQDVALLIQTDQAHERLSGPATLEIIKREYGVFGKREFANLKDISVSHLYNLRSKRQYVTNALFLQKTKPTPCGIGARRKPNPQSQPGFIRVDTVHQGDLDKEKGVYHINCVDEVSQWEIVGCVEKISEAYLETLLIDLLDQFPFRILGFHSDNGSEYINKFVARLLNKLLIDQTKSRSRHSNDNALVEGKNGSVIRKHMGHWHIAQRYAGPINDFYRAYFNPYLNYHRPCGFATVETLPSGKEKKVYNVYRTPFETLRTHPRAADFLKEDVSLEMLQEIAMRRSDNECAAAMQKAKAELFKNIYSKPKLPTIYAQAVSGS